MIIKEIIKAIAPFCQEAAIAFKFHPCSLETNSPYLELIMINYNTATQFWGALSITQLNPIVDAEFQIEKLLEKQSEQLILASVEIDSVESRVYRVWRDSRLLGTVTRDVANDLWISQPCSYPLTPRFESSKDAVMFIVEMNAFVTA
ncbi:MAG: hypothetical protein HC836_34745 [Richelia sp. RM2_1_2]|nr:hypothetical protein [Richelia sp. RM2_1_2]